MKKISRNQGFLLGAGLTIGVVVAIIFAITNLPIVPVIQQQRIAMREVNLPWLGADTGGGASCVVNVSIVKHGLYNYEDNITRNESMFAWGETNDTEIGANVPFDITVNLVVKVVWNRTHMYNTSSGNWTWRWVNATIAMTFLGYTAGYPGNGGDGHNISGEWNISEAGWVSTNDRTWGHYVFGAGTHCGDVGGAAAASGNNNGFHINRSQRVPTVYFKFFSYY